MPPSFGPHPNFDFIARPYRWLEYLTFGLMLERCRFHFLPELKGTRRALVLGDGDGRFLARMLAANPLLQADAVDLSPAMLGLLQSRAARIGAGERIALHCADARTFAPSGSYSLIVTHFFLDCLTMEEVETLVSRLLPHLAPGARWVVSEFAVPSGAFSVPANCIVRTLYAAFRLLTGLRVRRLPDYSAVLGSAGLSLIAERRWLRGLLVSELWEFSGNLPHTQKLP